MSRNSRRLLIQAMLHELHSKFGDAPGEDIYEKLVIGRQAAVIQWYDVEDRRPEREAQPADEDGPDDSTGHERLHPCALDILLHVRSSEQTCWSDIVDAVTAKGYSESTVGRWIRWLADERSDHRYIKNAGKNSPYRVV